MAFVDETIDVVADVCSVYSLWIAYRGYPCFMSTVRSVDVVGYDRLHWTADIGVRVVEWDVDVVEHVCETRVRWSAVDGRETGEVTLGKVDAGTTRVHYQLEFDPDAWGLERAVLEEAMEERVRGDLRGFKEYAEALACDAPVEVAARPRRPR
jgi:uncharacterized membrane protein